MDEKQKKPKNNYYKRRRSFNKNDKQKKQLTEGEQLAEACSEDAEIIEEASSESNEIAEEIKLEEAAAPAQDDTDSEQVEIVGIKFRNTGKVYYFSPNGITFTEGEHAIVETIRGMEYGDVSIGNKLVPVSETVSPLKPVLRKATTEDAKKNEQNRVLEANAKPIWEEYVAKNKLVMQLVDIEYTFDNAKLIFYFTADGRVDFRDLVKDLASVFRTRIELRQIGVRDEAKLIGGLGICGRPFCCKTFLSDFNQVSIKMAKEQNLSLSLAKISGTCGRLMCCLKFEHEVYEKEYATFPKIDSIVTIGNAKGVIIESNFLTGKVKVKMNDASGTVKTVSPSEVKVIGMMKSDTPIDKSLLSLEDK